MQPHPLSFHATAEGAHELHPPPKQGQHNAGVSSIAPRPPPLVPRPNVLILQRVVVTQVDDVQADQPYTKDGGRGREGRCHCHRSGTRVFASGWVGLRSSVDHFWYWCAANKITLQYVRQNSDVSTAGDCQVPADHESGCSIHEEACHVSGGASVRCSTVCQNGRLSPSLLWYVYNIICLPSWA